MPLMPIPDGYHSVTPYLVVEGAATLLEFLKRALDAGAAPLSAPAGQFYGDCSAGVVDPTGNRWYIATRIGDLLHDELAQRAAAATRRASEG